ncbi:MAG TPA: histone deacetylase [bacterium]|jgi:acetoin utilization deacetylase AcuC-like enzyme
MRTGLCSDPIFQAHNTGGHPENAGRLRAIVERIEANGIAQRMIARKPRPATREEVSTIHSVDYMRTVEEAALEGRHYLDTPDCVLSPETYTVALNAAGALVDAVLDVAEGRLDNAFVACRPPGHHAEKAQAFGFCYFNNIAIAAATLTGKLGYERVLIFDFDVHHGNGTQHAFEERKDVLFCSMHQHPLTLFPGTGFAEERGRGEGHGYTINVPMAPFATDADYLGIFEHKLLPVFRDYKPQFVLLSAGFDAHQDDPLAMINLTRFAFDRMLSGVKQLALECCEGKLVSALEGGYNYDALADCVASHLNILQSDDSTSGES